ncbi:MAG: hypothetical protein RL283_710 [Actinomycetota bacterium]
MSRVGRLWSFALRAYGRLPLGDGPTRAIRALSLRIFGVVRVGDIAPGETLLPSVEVDLAAAGVDALREEIDHAPLRIAVTPLPPDRTVRHPAYRLHVLPDALVAGDGRVFDARARLVRDSMLTHMHTAVNRGRLGGAATARLPGLHLNLNWWVGSTNIYHWHRDVVSRAWWLSGHDGRDTVTVLHPEDPTPFERHTLGALERRYPWVRLAPLARAARVRVERLAIATATEYLPGSGLLHPEVARWVRSVNLDGVDATGPQVDVLYTSRAGATHRRLRDEAELEGMLRETFGATVVRMETLPVAAQMALAARARVLVSVFGAGLAQVFFTLGDGVVEVSNSDARQTHFLTLAHSLGVPHRRVEGGRADDAQDFTLGPEGRDRVRREVAALLAHTRA